MDGFAITAAGEPWTHSFLIAVAGGVTVAAVGLLAAGWAAFRRARGEIATHDRLTAEHDEDLASWISDRHLLLRRQLSAMTAKENARGLYSSGDHGRALAELKEQALHEYRDQLRMHDRALATLYEREGRMHRYWRRRGKPRPAMTAPKRGAPVLDAWRADATRHCGEKGPAHGVVDPTRQDLDSALERLKDEGLKAYV
ncbi:MAG: hypothetical protein ABSB96_00695 [Gaiellaceae bacterium]